MPSQPSKGSVCCLVTLSLGYWFYFVIVEVMPCSFDYGSLDAGFWFVEVLILGCSLQFLILEDDSVQFFWRCFLILFRFCFSKSCKLSALSLLANQPKANSWVSAHQHLVGCLKLAVWMRNAIRQEKLGFRERVGLPKLIVDSTIATHRVLTV